MMMKRTMRLRSQLIAPIVTVKMAILDEVATRQRVSIELLAASKLQDVDHSLLSNKMASKPHKVNSWLKLNLLYDKGSLSHLTRLLVSVIKTCQQM